jgi:hypothetical protein
MGGNTSGCERSGEGVRTQGLRALEHIDLGENFCLQTHRGYAGPATRRWNCISPLP